MLMPVLGTVNPAGIGSHKEHLAGGVAFAWQRTEYSMFPSLRVTTEHGTYWVAHAVATSTLERDTLGDNADSTK